MMYGAKILGEGSFDHIMKHQKAKAQTAVKSGLWAHLSAEIIWRRERDSNPRYALTHTRFPVVRLRPAQPSLHVTRSIFYHTETKITTQNIGVMSQSLPIIITGNEA